MVTEVLQVAVLVLLGLDARLCSAQALKFPSLQSGSLINNLIESQPEQDLAKQGGSRFEKFPPKYDQTWQVEATPAPPLDSCEVDESSRVGCGEPGVTPEECEALRCCYDNRRFIQAYDGPMCYYGKTVTVQCTKDGQFVLVIARDATMPCINLDSISTLEVSGHACRPADSNSDFAIYQFPVTACGTRMKVEGDYVVFENMIASSYEVEFSDQGAITRDSSYEQTFQCRYLATAVGSLEVDVNTLPPPAPVFQQGPLRVELRLANGICATKGCSDEDIYSSYYTQADYPVVKALRDPVYVEVSMLERADPNIALVLNRCWATNTPDPTSTPRWDLLVNGCPYKGDSYLTKLVPIGSTSGLQYPTHYERFIVKMFSFVDKNIQAPLQQQIFIHCSTAVCQLTATETCKPSCSRTKRSISTLKEAGRKVIASSGMVVYIADSAVAETVQADAHEEEVSQDFGYGLYGVAAIAVLSICGLVAAVLRRRSTRRPCMQVTKL